MAAASSRPFWQASEQTIGRQAAHPLILSRAVCSLSDLRWAMVCSRVRKSLIRNGHNRSARATDTAADCAGMPSLAAHPTSRCANAGISTIGVVQQNNNALYSEMIVMQMRIPQ